MLKSILDVAIVLLGAIVIITVMLQPSKSDALSGLILGSNNDTFFSKNKGRTREVILARATMISMILFALAVVIMTIASK